MRKVNPRNYEQTGVREFLYRKIMLNLTFAKISALGNRENLYQQKLLSIKNKKLFGKGDYKDTLDI